MYQTFDNPSNSNETNLRLTELRKLLKKFSLNGFFIPRADIHQDEFIDEADARLHWISGFSGSAGLCLVLEKKAVIFTDNRYSIQVTKEVDTHLIQPIITSRISVKDWLKKNCKNANLGFDPWLHTISEIKKLNDLAPYNLTLKSCENLIDLIWTDRPKKSQKPIKPFSIHFSGVPSQDKKNNLIKTMQASNVDFLILTKPESINWLFNIRGSDIPHTPIVKSFAILRQNNLAALFTNSNEISKTLRAHLGNSVNIENLNNFTIFLEGLTNLTVQIDPETCPQMIREVLATHNTRIIEKPDPCIHSKAIKNETEIKGCRDAHLIDGVAVVKFLFWLEKTKVKLNEILIIKKLEKIRRENQKLKDIAFDTICGSGPNGAIIHYRVNHETNRKLMKNDLLLLDSGGQYEMGTTDVTRTIAIGTPSTEIRKVYTLILKGLISLSKLKWPEGLSGRDIDAFARSSLWDSGFDYDHGTGHGIGSYLSVHEGPHGISRKNHVILKPGMLFSNEPGYYKQGEFGIRLENILLIKKPVIPLDGDRQMLTTETLTLVPFDKKLIETKLLTCPEIDWINNYHEDIFRQLEPLIDIEIGTWLKEKCSPL